MTTVPYYEIAQKLREIENENNRLRSALLAAELKIAQLTLRISPDRRESLSRTTASELSEEELVELLVPEIRAKVLAAGGWVKYCKGLGLKP